MSERRLNVIMNTPVSLVGQPVGGDEVQHTVDDKLFRIHLRAIPVDGDETRLIMRCADEGYEMIFDYKLYINEFTYYVEFEKWDKNRKLLDVSFPARLFGIVLKVRLREVLSAQDLSVSTSYRNFRVLISDKSFYVNTAQLKELGGRLFNDWYEREAQSEDKVVVQSMSAEELSELLIAVCGYSTPVVHQHNFELLLDVSRRCGITGLLRRVESFLIEQTTIHPIRKLEYAAEFRLAGLADNVLRSFPTRWSRLECLFDYLEANGESVDDVHLDVLDMCEIFEDCIVL